MKVNKEEKAVIIFFSTIAIIALVLAGGANWMMSKQVAAAVSGKSCKVVEVNLYNGLESVKCNDGIIYTYKK